MAIDYYAQLDAAKALGKAYAETGIAQGDTEPEESPLSSEWAGSIVPADIPGLLGLKAPEGENAAFILNELADSWEDGYYSANWPNRD